MKATFVLLIFGAPFLVGCASTAPQHSVPSSLNALMANCPDLVCFRPWEFGAMPGQFGAVQMVPFDPIESEE